MNRREREKGERDRRMKGGGGVCWRKLELNQRAKGEKAQTQLGDTRGVRRSPDRNPETQSKAPRLGRLLALCLPRPQGGADLSGVDSLIRKALRTRRRVGARQSKCH